MKLELNAQDLRNLAEQGLLNEVIMKCTVGGLAEQGVGVTVTPVEPAPVEAVKEEPKEEKPKKKRTSKKKEEPTVAEASQEVAETTAPSPVGLETAVTPNSVPEPVPNEMPEPVAESLNIEQLAQKAIAQMDAGRGSDLQALLQEFGVSSLPELQPEQYVAFYEALEER